MDTSREDVGIAIRSAFLRRDTKQRFSLFLLVIISIFLLFLEKIEINSLNYFRFFVNIFITVFDHCLSPYSLEILGQLSQVFLLLHMASPCTPHSSYRRCRPLRRHWHRHSWFQSNWHCWPHRRAPLGRRPTLPRK